MKIIITNQIDGAEAKIINHDDETVEIVFQSRGSNPIGTIARGQTVKIRDREYIVLDHSEETTAVISKDIIKKMSFGSDNNYSDSKVNNYLNCEYLKEFAKEVGMDNIVEHSVCLIADDGTGKSKNMRCKVSLITTENYRRYREFLPACGNSWWTATPVSNDSSIGYSRGVCYVNSNGVLNWYDCDYEIGIRPFCILKSSVLVS